MTLDRLLVVRHQNESRTMFGYLGACLCGPLFRTAQRPTTELPVPTTQTHRHLVNLGIAGRGGFALPFADASSQVSLATSWVRDPGVIMAGGTQVGAVTTVL